MRSVRPVARLSTLGSDQEVIMSKKLINSPDTCVDECLYGLTVAHPQLRLHPEQRVVLDGVVNERRKVAVISGGGAGHEPFAAGYVGPGMLTAAISGSVFASPPSSHVMHAIRSVASHNDAVFLVIPNYTGDILNFGLSVELARGEGMNIESIVIGEDIALQSYGIETRAGRRGMCGMVVVFKVLGYLSWRGAGLEEVRGVARLLSESMASIGLGVTACSLPGAGPLFQLGEHEMELGVGVHGEAGVQRMRVATAAQVIDTFLEHLLQHLDLGEGGEVVAVVNNLGALTNIEQWLLAGELQKQLACKGVQVARTYAGPIFTSLNMAGVQVCLLKLTSSTRSLLLEALDAPTGAPGWPGCSLSTASSAPLVNYKEASGEAQEQLRGPRLPEKQSQALRKSIQEVARAMIASEGRLNELDSGCGDGDCGTTLRHLAQDMHKVDLQYEHPATLAGQLASIAQHTMGGTSGALYSLFFTAASQELEQLTDLSRGAAWAKVWGAGLKGMKKYSIARVGDRTMFDALEPGYEAFQQAISEGTNGVEALTAAVRAAKQGCANTSTMRALAGRASYVGASQLKEVDAGAFAVVVWLVALLDSFH